MESRSVYSAHHITRDAFRQFVVEDLGGHWNDEPTLEQGVVEHQGAVVYISLEMLDLEPDELDDVRVQLGAEPIHQVVVGIGHATGSAELADFVVIRVRKKWGAVELPETS